ncbi:MAG: DUF2868 domain-containing protein [Moraxella sp.]|uniref:DUF2868 domain-containing protein n=1 Tax=Moraxella sp. TaxID=479 RepID=UPI0026DAE49B|nr:DUF2868 domain-containing protein [Moraxella sp.]MDO4451005.1 DUF2868 domain-containing protein [Moraxella sp.]
MSLEHIHIEKFASLNELDPDTQKHLDLIRRLEKSGFIFATDPKVATDLAKSTDGTPTDKLVHRATLMDNNGELATALHKGDFLIKGVGRLYAGASFVLGFVGVFGLLNAHVVNFFYVLLGLLGWHTLTLVMWSIGLKNPNRYSGIYGILAKLRPKSLPEATAFDIYLEEFQKNTIWQLGKIIHKAWLFGLLGSVLALLMLFLFKSYAFIWESTLLSQSHFVMILKGLGFAPSLLGFEMPSQINLSRGDIPPARLATLMMLSVIIYGMLPRLCAYVLCYFNARERFTLDGNLYYYENLLRTLNQTIVDKDDFTPYTPKTTQITPNTHSAKIIATLERPATDSTWHGQSKPVKDLGIVDSKEEIIHLIKVANTLHAQILLGIDSRILPDRGVLRKIDAINQNSEYGVLVRFLHGGTYIQEWRMALSERNILEY